MISFKKIKNTKITLLLCDEPAAEPKQTTGEQLRFPLLYTKSKIA